MRTPGRSSHRAWISSALSTLANIRPESEASFTVRGTCSRLDGPDVEGTADLAVGLEPRVRADFRSIGERTPCVAGVPLHFGYDGNWWKSAT